MSSNREEEMVTVIEVYERKPDGSVESYRLLGGGCEACARVYGSPAEACLGEARF